MMTTKHYIAISIVAFWLFGIIIMFVVSHEYWGIAGVVWALLGVNAIIAMPIIVCLRLNDDGIKHTVKWFSIGALAVAIFGAVFNIAIHLIGVGHPKDSSILATMPLFLTVPLVFVLLVMALIKYTWKLNQAGKVSAFISMFISIILGVWALLWLTLGIIFLFENIG